MSDFIFGVSTTRQRFIDTAPALVDEWAYWLSDQRGRSNGGKLVLTLLDATDQELRDARASLQAAGVDADVLHAEAAREMAVRYLALIPAMYNQTSSRIGGKKWFVLCDDDTFFPSPHGLVEALGAYEPSRPLYVGALSEDVENVARHGSQAFGGAGVFISKPLAAELAGHYSSCRSDGKVQESNSGWGPQGDILLRQCIYDNTDEVLSVMAGLWQLDLHGDPSGFYESGIKPLSLHHYRGGNWHVGHPADYTRLSHRCGEDCFMQRFQTADDFIIATSFSIARYPGGIDFDTGQFEGTFRPPRRTAAGTSTLPWARSARACTNRAARCRGICRRARGATTAA